MTVPYRKLSETQTTSSGTQPTTRVEKSKMNAISRTGPHIHDIIQSDDLSNTIFSFLADGLINDRQVHRTRRVSRTFDSAVRHTCTKLNINTANGPFDLCKRWPAVTDLFISGLFIDDDSAPFVFPDPAIFATLFPALKHVVVYKAAVDVTSMLHALSGVSGLISLDMQSDWGSDYPDQFRIVTGQDVAALASVVQNTALERLSLTDMSLTAHELGFGPLVSAFAANTSIVDLDLSSCTFRFADIAHVLRFNRTIQTLALDTNFVDTVQPLADLLAQNGNTTLKNLSIIGVDIHALTTAMRTNTTIESLAFGPFGETDSDNSEITVQDFFDIDGMIAANSTITTLVINGNRAVRDNESFFNSIEQEGPAIEMNGFLANKTLKTFAFVEFESDEEFDIIQQNMCENIARAGIVTDLTVCSVCYNALLNLSGNTTLTSLNLPNECTDSSVDDLVEIFKSMTNLSELVIGGYFDSDDKQEFTESLAPCTVQFS